MAKKIGRKSHKKLPQNPKGDLPVLLFAAKTPADEARLTRLKAEKKIHKIGPRLYASVPIASVAHVVRNQWSAIVSELYPHALLSHRSALEYKPSPKNELILTSTTNRQVRYPGLTLQFVRGPAATMEDLPFVGFHVSSRARAFLENFSTGKKTAGRSLTKAELETLLNEILGAKGERELNDIRDNAKELAKKFGWQREYKKLDQMIGALLGTRSDHGLESAQGRARARGRPFDALRVGRFDLLLGELRATPLKEIKDTFKAKDHFKNKAFFDAYFSNYIEGTIFDIEEAEEIVFDKKFPKGRPKDAHDILGTFNIASDSKEIRITPGNVDELEELLIRRHRILMASRPEVRPGEFKEKPNRAGETVFVRPDEMKGTLEKGFQRYQDLPPGLARAIFVTFLVAEVHPFVDGNGRIARLMMNAELQATGLSTIIIPNVYREDYISGLRALTRRDRPGPLVRMLARAHMFSHLEFSPYKTILDDLTAKNWFRDPDEAKIHD